MKIILSYLLILTLAAPATMAAKPARGSRPIKVNSEKKTEPNAADIEKACTESKDPFVSAVLPKEPAPKLDETVQINEENPNLKFDLHCADASGRVSRCDDSLARILKHYREGKASYKGLFDTVCKKAKEDAAACANQANSLKCVGDLYSGVATKFNEIGDKLKNSAQKLGAEQVYHHKEATKLVTLNNRAGNASAPVVPAPASSINDPTITTAAVALIKNEATTGEVAQRGPAQTSGCTSRIHSKKFCSHITAASDSVFFAKKLKAASEEVARTALSFTEKAAKVNEAIVKSGNVNSGGDTSGGGGGGSALGGLGGLDGIMKMATLGVTAAGLYCTVSGQCSQQSTPQTAATDPSGIAATSPTPSSTNPAVETSSTGDPEKISNNTPITADSKTPVPDAQFGTESYASGGSGFSSDSPSDNDLAPFAGALERAPASNGSVGSGGVSAGGSEASSSGELPPVDNAKGFSMDSGGFSSGSGGGGIQSPGSFTLGDSSTASPADSALKDILNGEAPLDSSFDAALDGGDSGIPSLGSTELDGQSSDSLFYRVKDTHVRCMKRGCVGHGVGENI